MKAELDIIDSMIYSKLKNTIVQQLGNKYHLTDKNFSTVKAEPTDAVFPYIYFTLISAIETSNDLEGTTLRGGLYTYQINVYDNASQDKVRDVMNCVTSSMKNMAFQSASLPMFASNSSVHCMIARWQRNIDEGDTI